MNPPLSGAELGRTCVPRSTHDMTHLRSFHLAQINLDPEKRSTVRYQEPGKLTHYFQPVCKMIGQIFMDVTTYYREVKSI